MNMDCTRRRFLRTAAALVAGTLLGEGLLAGTAGAGPEDMRAPAGISEALRNVIARRSPAGIPRSLSFRNTHTGESLDATYWSEGAYRPDALTGVNHILRDYRTGEIKNIDPNLLDLLHEVRTRLGSAEPFHIISGYRSPETNAALRRQGHGVAAGSLHMEGRAIDVRLPGISLEVLRDAGLALGKGGVGFYPASDFVHLDTGRVRQW